MPTYCQVFNLKHTLCVFNIEFEKQRRCIYISKLMKTTFKDTGALDSEFSGRATWIHTVFEILIKREGGEQTTKRGEGEGKGGETQKGESCSL